MSRGDFFVRGFRFFIVIARSGSATCMTLAAVWGELVPLCAGFVCAFLPLEGGG